MTITRRFEIDAGHRLLRHESKCHNLHGHRYVCELTMAGELDKVGRVIDFGCVKDIVGGWLDREWDHGFLVERGDPLTEWLEGQGLKYHILDVPPTAENLVVLFRERATELLAPYGVQVVGARVYETPNCWADA